MTGMWLGSPMIGNPEIGLVLLTVFSQMAAGVTVFLLLSRMLNKEQAVSAGAQTLTRRVVNVALAATVLGGISSLTHIGQPARIYGAIFYHLSSWMGREALLLVLFTVALLVYAALLFKGSGPKPALEMIAAVTGVLAVIAGSLIYATLGSVPAWNNFFTVAFFLLSFLLLGGSLFLLVMALPLKSGAEGKSTGDGRIKTFSSILAYFLLSAVVITVAYLGYLGMGGAEAKKTLLSMTGSAIFWLRIVIGLLAPLIIMGMLLKTKGGVEAEGKTFSYLSSVFALVLAGEIMGRILFFTTSAMHVIGGNGSPY